MEGAGAAWASVWGIRSDIGQYHVLRLAIQVIPRVQDVRGSRQRITDVDSSAGVFNFQFQEGAP